MKVINVNEVTLWLLLCIRSLFDDGAKRYTKLRQSVQKFTVVQLGTYLVNYDNACYAQAYISIYLIVSLYCILGLSAFQKADVCSSQ